MLSFVYRSQRKAETYLYLAQQDDGAKLPEAVRKMLGELIFVMPLELHASRKLAREDIAVVLANLRDSGFHIQFPPSAVPRPQ
jgi:hypothetical protein